MSLCFVLERYVHPLYLYVPMHSFPTRRSSNLTSTISGARLFQAESDRTRLSPPAPTVDSTGDLVKISASGTIATSRYCDHSPAPISASLSAAAASVQIGRAHV